MGLFRSGRSSGNPPKTSRISQELGRILAFGRDQLSHGSASPQFVELDLNRIISQFRLDRRSVNSASGTSIEADYYQQAVADSDGFTRELSELVLPIGGLAVYGGARLAGSLLGWEFGGPYYLAMLDASIEWKRGAGAGASWMAPYELNRWADTHRANS
jgi:hypothetical protein